MVGIVKFEGESEHRCNRGQRDIPLLPVQTHTDGLFAIPLVFADDTAVDQRRGIGSGLGRRQCKTGDLVAGGNGDGSNEVYVANSDGTGIVQITTSADNSGIFTSGAPGALEIAGLGNYVVFGSDADHTGDNPSQTHTVFWATADGATIGQPLREGYVPPTIDSRAADNPHVVNDGAGMLFDSAVNYSFDATGAEDKIFTTVIE